MLYLTRAVWTINAGAEKNDLPQFNVEHLEPLQNVSDNVLEAMS